MKLEYTKKNPKVEYFGVTVFVPENYGWLHLVKSSRLPDSKKYEIMYSVAHPDTVDNHMILGEVTLTGEYDYKKSIVCIGVNKPDVKSFTNMVCTMNIKYTYLNTYIQVPRSTYGTSKNVYGFVYVRKGSNNKYYDIFWCPSRPEWNEERFEYMNFEQPSIRIGNVIFEEDVTDEEEFTKKSLTKLEY